MGHHLLSVDVVLVGGVSTGSGACTATHFEAPRSSTAGVVSHEAPRSFSASLLVALSSEVVVAPLSPDEDEVSEDVDSPEDDPEIADLSETSDSSAVPTTGVEMTSASASESHSDSDPALTASGLAAALRLLRLCLRLSASFYCKI